MTTKLVARSQRSRTRNALQLLRLHGNLPTQIKPPHRPPQERRPIRVERFMDRLRSGYCSFHRCAGSFDSGFGGLFVFTLLNPLDDRRTHTELDQIQGDKPDDVLESRDQSAQAKSSIQRGEALTQTQMMPIQPPEIE